MVLSTLQISAQIAKQTVSGETVGAKTITTPVAKVYLNIGVMSDNVYNLA